MLTNHHIGGGGGGGGGLKPQYNYSASNQDLFCSQWKRYFVNVSVRPLGFTISHKTFLSLDKNTLDTICFNFDLFGAYYSCLNKKMAFRATVLFSYESVKMFY